MINRTVYALRHKPTGRCMPDMKSGFSRWEPIEDEPHPLWLPRLFITKRSAENALTAYLRGPWECPLGTEGSYEEGYFDYKDVPIPTGKALKHPRVRSDFEVATLRLQEVLVCAL